MSSYHRDIYQGFEQGPIRPPSEARSLLIRVTRNCPWNHCLFCPLYKGTKFSLRPIDHIKKDIDKISEYLSKMQKQDDVNQQKEENSSLFHDYPGDTLAVHAAYHWYRYGMKSVFLQDSNTLIVHPRKLIQILQYLKQKFPEITRITSYARSATITKITLEDLRNLKRAGLTRIHVGLESGSDKTLNMVRKGATKEVHIEAGNKIKEAEIELSEYVMPGLGGRGLSREHAVETADALNQINPDYIRLRQFVLLPILPLYKNYIEGTFHPCNDTFIVKELSLFLKNLQNTTSVITSDHILNLFSNFEGTLPQDKDRIGKILNDYLQLPLKQQIEYRVGRRLGIYATLNDLENPLLSRRVIHLMKEYYITHKNIDTFIENLMQRFI